MFQISDHNTLTILDSPFCKCVITSIIHAIWTDYPWLHFLDIQMRLTSLQLNPSGIFKIKFLDGFTRIFPASRENDRGCNILILMSAHRAQVPSSDSRMVLVWWTCLYSICTFLVFQKFSSQTGINRAHIPTVHRMDIQDNLFDVGMGETPGTAWGEIQEH